MPHQLSDYSTGLLELNSYLNSLYDNLDICMKGLKGHEYDDVKKMHSGYTSALRNNYKSLNSSVSEMDKIIKGFEKKAKAAAEKGRQIDQTTAQAADQKIAKYHQSLRAAYANLYTYLDPSLDITGIVGGIYTKLGVGAGKFKDGVKILKKYYLEPEEIAEITKNVKKIKRQREKTA